MAASEPRAKVGELASRRREQRREPARLGASASRAAVVPLGRPAVEGDKLLLGVVHPVRHVDSQSRRRAALLPLALPPAAVGQGEEAESEEANGGEGGGDVARKRRARRGGRRRRRSWRRRQRWMRWRRSRRRRWRWRRRRRRHWRRRRVDGNRAADPRHRVQIALAPKVEGASAFDVEVLELEHELGGGGAGAGWLGFTHKALTSLTHSVIWDEPRALGASDSYGRRLGRVRVVIRKTHFDLCKRAPRRHLYLYFGDAAQVRLVLHAVRDLVDCAGGHRPLPAYPRLARLRRT
mmetsp:Transcript_5816/g.19579  ORF Transcript_5816/g.19579 Transcript_5816/m.19579 type:complete len:294 (-) Transcript_5816:14-895(-)